MHFSQTIASKSSDCFLADECDAQLRMQFGLQIMLDVAVSR
jgi:hypothetical protein